MVSLNTFQEPVLCSPVTDALLLLVFFQHIIFNNKIFDTCIGSKIHDTKIGFASQVTSENKFKALFGLHNFTG